MMVNKLQRFSRTLKEQEQSHCQICAEAITNPICPSCIAEQINEWTASYPKIRDRLLPKIKRYLKDFLDKEDGVSCIKCKKASTLCPYCFSDFIEGQLKKINSSLAIIEEFNEMFDFDDFVPNPYLAKWTPIGRL